MSSPGTAILTFNAQQTTNTTDLATWLKKKLKKATEEHSWHVGFIQTPAFGSMDGKRPPLLISKSIFFRGLLKKTNGDGFCTLRMNRRGKSSLLLLSLPFSATLEGIHLCKQMAGKFWKSKWCVRKSWGLQSGMSSSSLPGKSCLLCSAGLQPKEYTLVLLFYPVEEAITSPQRQRRELFPLNPLQPEQIKEDWMANWPDVILQVNLFRIILCPRATSEVSSTLKLWILES